MAHKQSDVEFAGEDGVVLRGWLFEPDGLERPGTVVMAHGFSGVKEMGLADYAHDWVELGLAVLAFDYTGFGDSGGAVRQEVDPERQARDFSCAITHVLAQPQLSDRVGVWGSSFGGGHAITVAATDPRVTCAVAQVPGIGILQPVPLPASWQAIVDADLAARAAGRPALTVPVVTEDPNQFAVISGDDRAYRYFHKTQQTMAPNWRNEVTGRSLQKMIEYSPIRIADRVRIPTLVITASHDVLTTPESARLLASRIGDSCQLAELDCTHFEVYTRCRREGAALAGKFLLEHLGG